MPGWHKVAVMNETRKTQGNPASDRLPASDAAALLGVSLRTLDRYQAAGIITPLPVPLRPRYFAVEQLQLLTRPASEVKVMTR